MKFIGKLAESKTLKLILLIWVILLTGAFVFRTVHDNNRYNQISDDLRWLGNKIYSLESDASDVDTEIRRLKSETLGIRSDLEYLEKQGRRR